MRAERLVHRVDDLDLDGIVVGRADQVRRRGAERGKRRQQDGFSHVCLSLRGSGTGRLRIVARILDEKTIEVISRARESGAQYFISSPSIFLDLSCPSPLALGKALLCLTRQREPPVPARAGEEGQGGG